MSKYLSIMIFVLAATVIPAKQIPDDTGFIPVDLPVIELPKIELPKIDLPKGGNI